MKLNILEEGMIGGEKEIRTPGPEKPDNGFRDRRLRPLSHLSVPMMMEDIICLL